MMAQTHAHPRAAPTAARPAPWLPRLGYGALLVTVLLGVLPYQVGMGDTFIQLRTGQYILERGILHVDPFSFMSPAAGHPYTEHEWLTCVLFFLLYHSLGAGGLLLYKIGCLVLAGIFVGRTARLLGAHPSAVVLTEALLLVLVLTRTNTRPHMVSLVFLAWYGWHWTRVEQGHWSLGTLWGLVPVHWLWSQMHGGHMVGLALLGVGVAVEAAHWWQGRATCKAVLLRGAVWLGCVGVVACGPYGVGMLLYPFREAALEHAIGWNTEWGALWRQGPHPVVWGVALVCLTTLWWAEGRHWPAWLRWGSRGGWGLIGLLSLLPLPTLLPLVRGALLVLFCGEVVLWLVGAWRRPLRWHQAARVAVAFGLAIAYSRALGEVLPIVLAPVLARQLTALLMPHGGAHPPTDRWLVGTALVVLLGGSTLFARVGVPPRPFAAADQEQIPGWGLSVPAALACATDFLRHHTPQGRLWTTHGSWFVWALWPAITVSTDTRLHVYSPALLDIAHTARFLPARLDTYLGRFQPTMLALHYTEVSQEVMHALGARGWWVVHLNDGLFVMVDSGVHGGLWPYQHILPQVHLPVTRYNARAVLWEADRALAQCPAAATFVHAYRARALTQLGRYAEAARARQLIPKRRVIE
jgi:hypothetical protein